MNRIHYVKLLYFLALTFIVSCSRYENPTVNYRQKQISLNNYEMYYECGYWDHPDYSKAYSSAGNQRIVIETDDVSMGITQVIIPWRRRDDKPQEKDVIIVDAKTNTPVEEKYILEINNAFGHILFKPNKLSSTYYIYYLPHHSTGGYYPHLTYDKPAEPEDESWFSRNKLSREEIKSLPRATIISAQSIDDFHTFFPMEIIATEKEVSEYISRNPRPYYIFPEYRKHLIKMH